MSFISTQLRDNCLQYPMAEEAADEIDRLENEHSKLLDALEAAQARIKELEAKQRWIPMDSAPKDGSEVLLQVEYRAGSQGKCLVGHWMPGGHCIEDHPPIAQGWYFWNGASFDLAAKPILWMPLPQPPEQESER